MPLCKVCQQPTKEVIDFGSMPIANGFIEEANQDKMVFNMSVVFCPQCYMVQLGETVKPEDMFNDHYAFISSTSDAMANHFKEIAKEIIDQIKGVKGPFIVELGCNDGIMLKHIAKRKIKHLGFEPSSNVAAMARDNGVEVSEKFFNEVSARQIAKKQGQADLICGSNVFCHMEDINSVFKGIDILLKDDGILFFEDPYLLDIVQKSSFDQIYDEHVYYYSAHSVIELAKRHNMKLVDMAHQDVHGGSMRYYLIKSTMERTFEKIEGYRQKEAELNLDNEEGYNAFKNNVDQVCADLKKTLQEIKDQGNRIVGYGATSKSTTLLNYAKIGPELIDYISDTTPNKIGKLTPGTHIPIKSYEEFKKDDVKHVLLLAWNHEDEIRKKEKKFLDKGGKFITYFPKVEVK